MNFIQNKKGSLLIMSYLVIVVLITLGAAFVIVSSNESRIAERQRRSALALHIAEAGIERALYDLRQDFIDDSTDPSWADGSIHGFTIGPNTSIFYLVNYTSTSLNGGTYTVELKNVAGSTDEIWVKSTGVLGDERQVVQVYAKIYNISPWNNAIFAGAGASGTMVNGNVNIRGSVHILGTGLQSTDLAVDLGGTAELMGNNYSNLDSSLAAKVPALPTTTFGGETVETLNAELRVKRGIVGLSGSSSVGQAQASGNSVKETVDGTYVTDGFGGSQGTSNVYSDNGTSNAYDLGDTVQFPRLTDPYPGYSTFQAYLRANALVITDSSQLNTLANISPTSNFSFSDSKGSIRMNGSGNLTISGIVYLANDLTSAHLNMNKAGNDKTINYTGSGVIFVSDNVNINVNLVTNGNNSFPSNILGIMTPNTIGFNEANIDVMGLFYAENTVRVEKQTDLVGTIVSNYFDMGTNVPSVYQVPEVINHLPGGIIGQQGSWMMKTISWQKL